MAAIAERTGGPLEVVWRVKRSPPVRATLHKVGPPDMVADVPLCRKREVVVAYACKVALLPLAAIHERDVVFPKGNKRVRFCEVGKDGIRMLLGRAHHICHARLRPALIQSRMARFARRRSDIGCA